MKKMMTILIPTIFPLIQRLDVDDNDDDHNHVHDENASANDRVVVATA